MTTIAIENGFKIVVSEHVIRPRRRYSQIVYFKLLGPDGYECFRQLVRRRRNGSWGVFIHCPKTYEHADPIFVVAVAELLRQAAFYCNNLNDEGR